MESTRTRVLRSAGVGTVALFFVVGVAMGADALSKQSPFSPNLTTATEQAAGTCTFAASDSAYYTGTTASPAALYATGPIQFTWDTTTGAVSSVGGFWNELHAGTTYQNQVASGTVLGTGAVTLSFTRTVPDSAAFTFTGTLAGPTLSGTADGPNLLTATGTTTCAEASPSPSPSASASPSASNNEDEDQNESDDHASPSASPSTSPTISPLVSPSASPSFEDDQGAGDDGPGSGEHGGSFNGFEHSQGHGHAHQEHHGQGDGQGGNQGGQD